MIATIKTPSIGDMKRGLWKAMDLGVECDVFSDNTFNIVVHEQKRADAIGGSQGQCQGSRFGTRRRRRVALLLQHSQAEERHAGAR